MAVPNFAQANFLHVVPRPGYLCGTAVTLGTQRMSLGNHGDLTEELSDNILHSLKVVFCSMKACAYSLLA